MIARALVKTIRVGAGLSSGFAGAALLGAALPAAISGGDGLIAIMFLPAGAGLLGLSVRWIHRWAWGIAAALIGYLGIWAGVHGVVSQGADPGSAGHVAGWLTAAVAIPCAYLAIRGLRRRKVEPITRPLPEHQATRT